MSIGGSSKRTFKSSLPLDITNPRKATGFFDLPSLTKGETNSLRHDNTSASSLKLNGPHSAPNTPYGSMNTLIFSSSVTPKKKEEGIPADLDPRFLMTFPSEQNNSEESEEDPEETVNPMLTKIRDFLQKIASFKYANKLIATKPTSDGLAKRASFHRNPTKIEILHQLETKLTALFIKAETIIEEEPLKAELIEVFKTALLQLKQRLELHPEMTNNIKALVISFLDELKDSNDNSARSSSSRTPSRPPSPK